MAWWDTYEGRQRLAVEKAMMRQTYGEDNAKLCMDRSRGQLYWLVTQDIEGKGPHTVRVVYPCDNYPDKAPTATAERPSIRSNKHQYGGKELCLFNPNEGRGHGWDPSVSTAVTIAAWAFEWLNAYYIWKRTKRWPGYDHNIGITDQGG